ncbi:MAG TPA: AMP-binding protein [bacterium]|jgi:acyl-coenzyme A synthetase/AMP-(fatty) acid ligase|nr:AMP-binding protein [bacterium]
MAPLISLPGLLALPADDRAVGLDAGQTRGRLARRRAAWASALSGSPDPIALHLADGFEFAAALLGAWSAGVSVYLPGDNGRETAASLRSKVGRLFIGDETPPPDLPVLPAPGPARMPDVPIVVFTSGSSGDPAAIAKPSHCIQNELEALETAFGDGVGDAAFLSSVSHQHYYGLLFKILWPLAASRSFLSGQLRLPEEIAAAAARARRCVLVTSPALLKRIGGSPASLEVLAPAKASLVAVFSSGGPLPFDAVRRSRAALGQTPVEVYGSSENGGVGWRRRGTEADPWIPLPGVETRVDPDGVLSLRSRHGNRPEWTRSEDRATPAEPGFHLLGRVDRIAKVEEKRVSLAGLERRLAAHPSVEEARVLLLKGVRDLLGAVVRLKDPAPAGAAERRARSEELRRHLDEDGVAPLPRRWRFVDSLPADSMGKNPLAALEALFMDEETREAECLYVQHRDQGVDIDLFLPASLRWFKGHFPGHPLLPGVVQLHWAVRAAREHLGVHGAFRGLRALKFMRPLRPGQRVTLSLVLAQGGVEFRYASEEGRHASGHIVLG